MPVTPGMQIDWESYANHAWQCFGIALSGLQNMAGEQALCTSLFAQEVIQKAQHEALSRPTYEKPLTELYLVILEDRHIDVDVFPCSTRQDAELKAQELVRSEARDLDHITVEELTTNMEEAGWIRYVTYSVEGDSVRIVKRTLDGEVS